MIGGIGTDVVEISRIAAALRRYGDRFVRRVLHPLERNMAANFPAERLTEFVAGRFAAKEAVAKAAGIGLGVMGLQNVAIVLEEGGLRVRFASVLEHAAFVRGRWWVSISHSQTVAMAVAVREVSPDNPS
ncbi:holo-ACP synthase [Alicyclobacillus shizuokensis]|uniref:holo-ACP synthase n=1 Tax=Alicyclobacillus shizuokensis TaxID=392014 RepID=UPI000834ED7D|nr:holo-ACP synthase [Alicyclobacillus shizuokensis]MCL6626632.1 holo-ACP synthase [Alicyclobacillus shizuokensis]